ncbi:MAG: hypothetical protein IKB06_04490 [Clostridia bacterium]|nr:hypothetical protein [Clostridia bacterium]
MISQREEREISENFEKKGWGDEIRDYSAYKHGGLTYYKWAMHAMSNRGPALQNIPMRWRTKEMCIAAVLSCKARGCDLEYSLKYVPEKFKNECANIYHTAPSSNSPERIRDVITAKFKADRNDPQKQEESLNLMESYIKKFDELRSELQSLKEITYRQRDLEQEKRERRIGRDDSKRNYHFDSFRKKLWDELESKTIKNIRQKIKELNEGEAEFFTATHICGGEVGEPGRDSIIEKVGGTKTWNPNPYSSRPENYKEMFEDVLKAYSHDEKIENIKFLMEDAKQKISIYNANLDYFTDKAREISPKAKKQVFEFFSSHIHIDHVPSKENYMRRLYERDSFIKTQEERVLNCGSTVNYDAVILGKIKQMKEGKSVWFGVDAKEVKPQFQPTLDEIIKIRAGEKELEELNPIIDALDKFEDKLYSVETKVNDNINEYINGSKNDEPGITHEIHSLMRRFEVVKLTRGLADSKTYELNEVYDQEHFVNVAKEFHYSQLNKFQRETEALIYKLEKLNLPKSEEIANCLKRLDVEQMLKQSIDASKTDNQKYRVAAEAIIVQDEKYFKDKEQYLSDALEFADLTKESNYQENESEVTNEESSQNSKKVEKEELAVKNETVQNETSAPEDEKQTQEDVPEKEEPVVSAPVKPVEAKEDQAPQDVPEKETPVASEPVKPVEAKEKQVPKDVPEKETPVAKTETEKKNVATKKPVQKTPREATLRQKFNISDEEEFDKLLVHYAQYNKSYYMTNGQKKTDDEIRKRRNVNAQFKRILKQKAEKEPKNENGEDFSTTINNIENGQVFDYAELKEVAENKQACMKLFQIMASGVYEKDGQRTRLTQKQRIALASTLEIVSGMRLDMSNKKGTKKQETTKTEKGIQME